MTTDNNLDPDSKLEQFLYKYLSFLGGKDLSTVQLEQLREKRKEYIETMGDPPFNKDIILETLTEMGLAEAEYMSNFSPDLLVVSEQQYRSIVDITVGIPLNPDNAHETINKNGLAGIQPPYNWLMIEGGIEVVYSDSVDRMCLVDSSKLSDTKNL